MTKARDTEPEIKWPMWLAAYSGGRLAEIVEAMTKDVEVTEEGIAVFHIRLDNRPPKRRVKNEFAPRPMPLHDAVLTEGFLAYVQWVKDTFYGGGDGPLFPQFKEWRGGINTDASSRVNDWLDDIGIDHPQKVFHSWRHTVQTRFREVDAEGNHFMPREDIADKLTGHAKGVIGRTYGYFPIPVLRANIKHVPDWFAAAPKLPGAA